MSFISEQSLVKILRYGVYAVLFVPLAVFPQFLFPFSTSRAFLFQIIVELLFALWIVLAIRVPAYRPKRSLILYALFAYFIALFASTIFGLDPYHSFFGNFERMWGYFSLLHFLLFFVVLTSVFRTREDWLSFVKVALVVSALTAGIGFAQYLLSLIFGGGNDRIASIIGNPAFFAAYLFFPLIFSALFWRELGKKWWYAALCVLTLLIILSTGTRGALVALLAILGIGAVIALIGAPSRKLKLISGIILAAGACLLAVLLMYGSLFQKPTRISEADFFSVDRASASAQPQSKLPFLGHLLKFSLYDNTTGTRLTAWRATLASVKDRPLLGVGQENFILAFNKYFSSDFYTYEKSEIWFDRAHNIFVDILVSDGIVGFTAYLSIFIACGWGLVRLFRRGRIGFPEFSALMLFFVAYLVQNMFLFDTFGVFLTFIIALGWVHAAVVRNSEGLAPLEAGPTSARSRGSMGGLPLTGFGAPLLIACALIYVYTIRPAEAAYYLATAESGRESITSAIALHQRAADMHTFGNNEARSRMALAIAKYVQALPSGDSSPDAVAYLDEGIAALQKDIASSNDELLLYRLQLSDLYNLRLARTGEVSPEIEDIIKKSIDISPGRMEFEFALAQTQFLKSDYAGGIQTLSEASAKNPVHPMPYWKISQNYHFWGKDDQAIPYLEKALYYGYVPDYANQLLWVDTYYVNVKDYEKIIFIDKIILKGTAKDDISEQVRLNMNLAVAYAELGKKEQAKTYAKAIETLDPIQQQAVDDFINGL